MANENSRNGDAGRRRAHARQDATPTPRQDSHRGFAAAHGRSAASARGGSGRRSSSSAHLRPADSAPLRTTDADGLTPRASEVREEDIQTLRSGQGARLTTRDNAAEAADIARRQAHRSSHSRNSRDRDKIRVNGRSVALVLVAVVVLVLVVLVVAKCTKSPEPAEQPQQEQQVDQQPAEDAQQQAAADDTVTYQGVTFSFDQAEDGTYVVMADDGSGNKAQTFGVSGTPVAIMMYNATIVVPENTSGGWDVVAYALGTDALPTLVVGPDGNPVGGSGQIQSATLDGSVVHVTDSTGATTDVALE